MGCIEIGLLIYGIVILTQRKVALNKQTGVVGGPAILMGLILILIFPSAIAGGFIMAAVNPPGPNTSILEYIWIDVAAVLIGLVLVAVIYGISPKVDLSPGHKHQQQGQPLHPYGKQESPPDFSNIKQPPHKPPSDNPFEPPGT